MGVDAPSARPRRSPVLGTLVDGLDVVLVVLGAIVVIAAGAPTLGAIIGAGVWILQRIVAVADRRLADRMHDRHTQIKIILFERFGRIWLLAGGIIVAGVAGSRRDGLTCAVFVFGAYTVVFVNRLFSGPPPVRDHP